MDDLDRLLIRQAEKQAGLRRLGGKLICCSVCPETDPACFEQDHIYGRKHGPDTRMLCVNCHRKRSARQRTEHPPPGPDPTNPCEIAARFLLGMIDYLEFIIQRLRGVAELLLALAARGFISISE
jgi:hypothetical protein